jgi:hypothetical protein
MRFGFFLGLIVALIASAGCGDDAEPGTVGLTCSSDLDCGPDGETRCAEGFVQLADDDTPDADDDVNGAIGLMMPADQGYCMQTTGCQDDSDCPGGSACFRPLADVSAGALTDVPFHFADLNAGYCLVPCTDATACRVDDGFTCGVPLEEELAGIPGVRQDTFCIPEALEPPCTADPARNLAGTCTLTYDVEGTFQITGTPAAQGDGTFAIGPGTLIVRVPSADGLSPSEGPASTLCYDMKQRFEIGGVITSVRAYATSSGSATLNSGALAGDTITWDECTYSTTYCQSDASWTPEDTATGPGCVAGYHSVGDVNCTLGNFCAVGSLQPDHNPQDGLWTQPFNDLVFASDFQTVSMGGLGDLDTCDLPDQVTDKVEIPNSSPGRTWLAFTGALRTMECTAP